MVESGRRVTDGGRLHALAAARERQKHLKSTRDARQAWARERTAACRQVDDSGALQNEPSGGKLPLWGGSGAPVFVIRRTTLNLFNQCRSR
eukprot:1140034-Pelagomonas_calceolata.AAC.2